MEKRIRYNAARNLSLLYVLYSIIGSFNYKIIGSLFLLIVFPYILFKMNQLIIAQYNVNLKITFNVVIAILICSVAFPLISPILFHFGLNTIYIVYTLIFARGISLIILGGCLLKRVMIFSKALIVTIVLLTIFGVYTTFGGVMMTPLRYIYFPKITSLISIDVIQNSQAMIFFLIFGSLFFVFNQVVREKYENEEVERIE